jgi:hypothetical protein
MAETTVKQTYQYNLPREAYQVEQTVWKAGSQPTVTLQPASGAEFIAFIKLLITDDFAMTNADVIELKVSAYGTTQTLTITSAGVAQDDLLQLVGWGDAEMYESMSVAGKSTHKVVVKFKPPVYLRTSTTPNESITLTYTGANVTAGQMIITTEGWLLSDEDDSGIY